MKKLHSIAFYALITPAMTLGAGSVLADPSPGPDKDKDAQSTQIEKDANNKSTQGEKNSQHALQADSISAADTLVYLDSAPANGMQMSGLIGAEVKTENDENIGSVSDLILDEDGQVVAILVGVGGFLGMGEKDVAIGWGHVTKSGSKKSDTDDEQELQVDVTREDLRSAPKFETKD